MRDLSIDRESVLCSYSRVFAARFVRVGTNKHFQIAHRYTTRLDSRSKSAKRIPRGDERAAFLLRSSRATNYRNHDENGHVRSIIRLVTERFTLLALTRVFSSGRSIANRDQAGRRRADTHADCIVALLFCPVEAASRSDTFRRNSLHDTVNDVKRLTHCLLMSYHQCEVV